jgi:hypothetical protein
MLFQKRHDLSRKTGRQELAEQSELVVSQRHRQRGQPRKSGCRLASGWGSISPSVAQVVSNLFGYRPDLSTSSLTGLRSGLCHIRATYRGQRGNIAEITRTPTVKRKSRSETLTDE